MRWIEARMQVKEDVSIVDLMHIACITLLLNRITTAQIHFVPEEDGRTTLSQSGNFESTVDIITLAKS